MVPVGASTDRARELVAVVDAHRESKLSWKEILLSLKAGGLMHVLAVGDGAPGFWKALRRLFPGTRKQRCTVHKTDAVLNKVPKSVKPTVNMHLLRTWAPLQDKNLCPASSDVRDQSPKPGPGKSTE